MKCRLELLLLAAASAAPAVPHGPLAKTASPDTRTVVISPHADVDFGGQRAPNALQQTVAVSADAKMMRVQHRAPEEDGCSDLIGTTACQAHKDGCDDPFQSAFMQRSCKLTCGVCVPIEPRVECEWDHWQSWSKCDASCGKGSQFRLRSIKQHSSGGGDECTGAHEESASCNEEECPTTTAIPVTSAAPVKMAAAPQSPAEEKKKKIIMWVGIGSAVGVVMAGMAYSQGLLPCGATAAEEKRPRSDTTLTTWTVQDDDDWAEDYDHSEWK